MTDNLTIAYLAIGAHNILRLKRDLPADFCGGQIEFIQRVIDYNTWLDNVYNDRFGTEGWAGVWCYDIVEPMGEHLARTLYKSTDDAWKTSPLTQLDSLIRRYA